MNKMLRLSYLFKYILAHLQCSNTLFCLHFTKTTSQVEFTLKKPQGSEAWINEVLVFHLPQRLSTPSHMHCSHQVLFNCLLTEPSTTAAHGRWTNVPQIHIFGLWEKGGMRGDNVRTGSSSDSNPTVLITPWWRHWVVQIWCLAWEW